MDLKDALVVARALRIDTDGTATSKELQAEVSTDEKWLAMANKARKGKTDSARLPSGFRKV